MRSGRKHIALVSHAAQFDRVCKLETTHTRAAPKFLSPSIMRSAVSRAAGNNSTADTAPTQIVFVPQSCHGSLQAKLEQLRIALLGEIIGLKKVMQTRDVPDCFAQGADSCSTHNRTEDV